MNILFYLTIYFVALYLEILEYLRSMWWLIGAIFAGQVLFSNWNRRRRINALTSEETMEGLNALIRIRSVEIGAIYHHIHTYLQKAKEKPWLPLFIAEYRNNSSYDIYDDQRDREKKEQKYKNKAYALYKKRFENNYDPFCGIFNESELADIGLALLYWTSNIDGTIGMLKSIRCDANLSQHVCALLREYRLIKLLTLNGNYHILFKNWYLISILVKERYVRLRGHWKEVILSHQNKVLTIQASRHLLKESFVLDDVWNECRILGDMESGLNRMLSQNNYKHVIKWNYEEIFFQNLQLNPIWQKLYGYEPGTFSEDDKNDI